MRQINICSDVVIIGDGISALSLAYVAARHNLKCVILGKNITGATNAATGFLAPRSDYMLHDLELVKRTAYECGRWRGIFNPQIVKPQLFLIPICQNLPESVEKFKALFSFYDRETAPRLNHLPGGYFRISRATLEKNEPNLRKGRFDGALALWEFTVNPIELLEKMRETVGNMNVESVSIKDILDYEVAGNRINKIVATDVCGCIVRIDKFHIVFNAAGPWIPDIWKIFGISLPMKLNIGAQAQISGNYLRSGIITFGSDKKHVVCIQKNGYVQIGPTNGSDDISPLYSVFADMINGVVPEISFLKSGYRVRPFAVNTQRPVIWNHKKHGFENFYSLHPGKMVLALLAADELLAKAREDGWSQANMFPSNKIYALDGMSSFKSNLKICWLTVKSFFALALYYLKYLITKNP